MSKQDEIRNPKHNSMGKIGNRPFWVLYLSVGIRAAHQVGCAVFLASLLLHGTLPSNFYTTLAFGSGLALCCTEGMRHRQLYREFAGLCTIFKLLFLGVAFHGFLPMKETIMFIFLLAAIGAHTPKNIRHRLLF